MPSISRWAKKQMAGIKVGGNKIIDKTVKVGGNKAQRDFTAQVSKAIDKSSGDEELEEMAMDLMIKSSQLQQKAIDLLWQETVVDITSTVKETAQMVLNDQSVLPDIRKARAQGLECLGSIFENFERTGEPSTLPDSVKQKRDELEKVAFHSMLDTVWRQEVSERNR